MRMLVGHDLPLYQDVFADYLARRFPTATIDRGLHVHLTHHRPDLVLHSAMPTAEQQQRILTWIVLPGPGETKTSIIAKGAIRQIDDLGLDDLSALIVRAPFADESEAETEAAIAELLQGDQAVFHPE
ncbi:MAG TPA: hypothetical protein PK691_07650 [Thermomicrobiales bacterium]|nr:hypothetical protein [Thermomicrobiales bacterium]